MNRPGKRFGSEVVVLLLGSRRLNDDVAVRLAAPLKEWRILLGELVLKSPDVGALR
jgi:hypothetical protein